MSTYIEHLVWSLIRTSFTKRTFCYLLLSLITVIIRTHLDAFTAYLLTPDIFLLDSLMRITVSTTLILNSKYIYDIVQRYTPEVYNLSRYLINNYNEKNFKRWKRKVNLTLCIYFYLITYIIDITNISLRVTIIEYVICYIIVELIDNIKKGDIKIFSEKQFSCSNNDDNIIDELIKKTENLNELDVF